MVSQRTPEEMVDMTEANMVELMTNQEEEIHFTRLTPGAMTEVDLNRNKQERKSNNKDEDEYPTERLGETP